VIARRRHGARSGSAVNLGFGISANVPRILLEEGATVTSPGSSSRDRSAAFRCSTSPLAAPRTRKHSCLALSVSLTSRVVASMPRCCRS
jgi:hypothetical protein